MALLAGVSCVVFSVAHAPSAALALRPCRRRTAEL